MSDGNHPSVTGSRIFGANRCHPLEILPTEHGQGQCTQQDGEPTSSMLWSSSRHITSTTPSPPPLLPGETPECCCSWIDWSSALHQHLIPSTFSLNAMVETFDDESGTFLFEVCFSFVHQDHNPTSQHWPGLTGMISYQTKLTYGAAILYLKKNYYFSLAFGVMF